MLNELYVEKDVALFILYYRTEVYLMQLLSYFLFIFLQLHYMFAYNVIAEKENNKKVVSDKFNIILVIWSTMIFYTTVALLFFSLLRTLISII